MLYHGCISFFGAFLSWTILHFEMKNEECGQPNAINHHKPIKLEDGFVIPPIKPQCHITT